MLNLTPLALGYLEATDGTIDHRDGCFYIDFFGDDSIELGRTEEEAQTTLNCFMRKNLPSFIEDWYGVGVLEYVTDEGIQPIIYEQWERMAEKPLPLMPLLLIDEEVFTLFEALDRFELEDLSEMIESGAARFEALEELLSYFPSKACELLKKSGL